MESSLKLYLYLVQTEFTAVNYSAVENGSDLEDCSDEEQELLFQKSGKWKASYVPKSKKKLNGFVDIDAEHMVKAFFRVTGMSCASCVATIEKNLLKKDGMFRLVSRFNNRHVFSIKLYYMIV